VDTGEVARHAISGAVASAIPAGVGAVLSGAVRAGEQAAVRRFIPPVEGERLGSEVVSTIAPEIKSLGGSSYKDIADKLTPTVDNLRNKISTKLIDSDLNVSKNNAVNFLTQGMSEGEARATSKLIQDNITKGQGNLTAADIWQLGDRLAVGATKGTSTPSKALMLKVSNDIRLSLPGYISKAGDTELAEDMQTYYKLNMIKDKAEKEVGTGQDSGLSLPLTTKGLLKSVLTTGDRAAISVGNVAKTLQGIPVPNPVTTGIIQEVTPKLDNK
jgi:hypothetical protein